MRSVPRPAISILPSPTDTAHGTGIKHFGVSIYAPVQEKAG